MNLSFLRYFRKDKASASPAAVATAPVPPIEKPASDRFGKTVMPNSSRIVGVEPARNFPVPAPLASPALATGQRKISLGGNAVIAVAPITPGGDRTIALPLVDLAPHIPQGLLRSAPIDPQSRVVLKAADVERGMSTGRPTALLRTIYQQAPEFFAGKVEDADKSEVLLPLEKVLEQFTAFQVRDDQICEQVIPHVETPFLKVTLEDSERFGTSAAPLKASAPAAGAKKTPAANPLAVDPAKPSMPVPLCGPEKTDPVAGGSPSKAPIRLDHAPAAPPIRARISPNGTGAPATERVPASSGPPVPTPSPEHAAPPVSTAPAVPPAPSAPTKIPFKVSAPSNDLRPPVLRAGKTKAEAEALAFSSNGPRVHLPLASILRGIPVFQLTGPIDGVPEDAMIELPFAIVEPQLALGKIAISPAQFQAAMPEKYRPLFKVDKDGAPIPLSLPEVLQNLPSESLRIRGDQEEVEIEEGFETPFSQKMAEDAVRIKGSGSAIPKPAIAFAPAEPEPTPGPVAIAPEKAPAPAVAPSPKPAIAPAKPKPARAKALEAAPAADGPAGRNALQRALDTDEQLNAKSVVERVSQMPGVIACAIVFSDGLSLAGNIPAAYEAEALCALAPSIVRRISDQMLGTSLGSLSGVTLYCAKAPVSFFAHGDICLAAIHSVAEIAPEIRDRLGGIAQELARMYANKPND